MAQRLRFTRDFEFWFGLTRFVLYRQGAELLVPTGAARAALAARAAIALEPRLQLWRPTDAE